MEKMISRTAAINEVERAKVRVSHSVERAITRGVIEIVDDIGKSIAGLPVTEQKTGKWVGADTQCGIACFVCGVAVDDFCHSADYIDLDYEPNFCPNCGAKMDEVTT